jgi:excinuclease ABC subunit A
MHFMGNVEVLCESCEGQRFDKDTLEILYQNKSIGEVLDLSVDQAVEFFNNEPKITRFLEIMGGLGLGYLTLGQRSSTLSGGEAQRIKLATELSKPQAPHTLYIMDEPSTGLHNADVGNLLKAIDNLIRQGHTVILTEHHPGIVFAADHIIDLGPGSGKDGARVVATRTPEEVVECGESLTGKELGKFRRTKDEGRRTKGEGQRTKDEGRRTREEIISFQDQSKDIYMADSQDELPTHHVLRPSSLALRPSSLALRPSSLVPHPSSLVYLKDVCTHSLKHITLSIPKNKITVITGVSGSGKSSLAFDTIHAEAQNRFMEGFSTYIRSRIGMKEKPDFEEISGLTATLALEQSSANPNPRSTVGTITGIYDFYRLLFSRAATPSPLGEGAGGEVLHFPEDARCEVSTLFSFNHQHGACPTCSGLGQETRCDATKLITNPELSILDGAMKGSKTGKFYGDPFGQYTATIKAVGNSHGIDYFKPWNDLTLLQQELVLSGCGEDLYEVTWEFKREQRTGVHQFRGKWPGLLELVEQEYIRKHADHRAEGMMNVMTIRNCSACSGSRLKPEALQYVIGGFSIADLSELPVSEAIFFFNHLANLPETRERMAIIDSLVGGIIGRLSVLADLGLPYLSIRRSIGTLSAGEERRVRLASLMGSGISGITYILDEPTAGLHPRDTLKLMNHIRSLCDRGNTVILVEHDRDVILLADHVIDMGPGAGVHGGRVVAEGPPEVIMQHPDSLTGSCLRNVELKFQPSIRYLKPGLKISHATIHNLKGFELEIPSGGIVAVTGVSGSGKSSLVFDLIYESWRQERPVGCLKISGFENFSRIIAVEQTREISSGTSVVATYTGLFDLIRDQYARVAEAKATGISRNHFSFLNKEGQCPDCEGRGVIKTSMDFLPDVEAICEGCHGKRYTQAVLNIRFRDKNIADVLSMTIKEAIDFMADNLKGMEILRILSDTGLGYVTLGQLLSTLSGGELQRLHLAVEMMKPVKGSSLYLFDEPTTGLHFHDAEQLLRLFDGLAGQGHSLLIIEHVPSVIAFADHVIELGPEGGNKGGFLIASSSRSR